MSAFVRVPVRCNQSFCSALPIRELVESDSPGNIALQFHDISHWAANFFTVQWLFLYTGAIISRLMPDPPAAFDYYCPSCRISVTDPLMCGDCHALICRICGTPLERIDDLGIG